jgi:dienelactone hydrolase
MRRPSPARRSFHSFVTVKATGLKVIGYPAAKHGFANPAAREAGEKFNLPLAYNADVDEESWPRCRSF